MSLIDSYLEKQETNSKIREKGIYFVTELCGNCLLSAYYNIKEEIPPGKRLLRIFETGGILEEWWVQKVLRNTPGITVIATQLPARVKTDRYEIHGRIDALSVRDNRLVVHEVKTARTSSWKNSPNEEHQNQISFYLHALGVMEGEVDIIDKTILLLGEDPRNPGLAPDKTFHVYLNDGTYQRFLKILDNAEKLHEAITTGIMPEPTPCWRCEGGIKYCDHIDRCLKDYPPAIPELIPTAS